MAEFFGRILRYTSYVLISLVIAVLVIVSIGFISGPMVADEWGEPFMPMTAWFNLLWTIPLIVGGIVGIQAIAEKWGEY